MSDTNTLVDKILAGDFADAKSDFNAIMAERVTARMDDEKAIVAAEIYNGHVRESVEEETDEEEITEDDINEFVESLAQEDVDFICEEEGVESLEELSGAKLGSYIVKSRKSEKDAMKAGDKALGGPSDEMDKKAFGKAQRTVRKRSRGQGKAIDKLQGSGFAKVHAT